jgi:hypothetical protein
VNGLKYFEILVQNLLGYKHWQAITHTFISKRGRSVLSMQLPAQRQANRFTLLVRIRGSPTVVMAHQSGHLPQQFGTSNQK